MAPVGVLVAALAQGPVEPVGLVRVVVLRVGPVLAADPVLLVVRVRVPAALRHLARQLANRDRADKVGRSPTPHVEHNVTRVPLDDASITCEIMRIADRMYVSMQLRGPGAIRPFGDRDGWSVHRITACINRC